MSPRCHCRQQLIERDLYCVRPRSICIFLNKRCETKGGLICRAGHETSGHTLAWTLDFLAVYPEWQDAVAKEITDLCGDNWPCRFSLLLLHPVFSVT